MKDHLIRGFCLAALFAKPGVSARRGRKHAAPEYQLCQLGRWVGLTYTYMLIVELSYVELSYVRLSYTCRQGIEGRFQDFPGLSDLRI